jgi:hypothetical protein
MIRSAGFKIFLGLAAIIGALPPSLFFQNGKQALIFSIVEYKKATSYSSGGAITTKTVSTTFYIQTNHAETGEKIAIKKIKHNSDIKNYPVKVMGGTAGRAWVFIGEPMAFDPFTLEKIADKKIIEEKNPWLKGKMPEQSQFYKYLQATDEIRITATDGIIYSLSANSLLAVALEENLMLQDPYEVNIKNTELNSENYNLYRVSNQLYSQRKMNPSAYRDSSEAFEKRRRSYRQVTDSLEDLLRSLEAAKRNSNSRRSALENLNNSRAGFSNITVDADTFHGIWYGLKTPVTIDKINSRFNYQHMYGETDRNKLYSSGYKIQLKPGADIEFDKPRKICDSVFLQGGFLLDKKTALPIHTGQDHGFIICHKEKVGNEGNMMISAVSLTGEVGWTVNTGIKDLEDYLITPDRLVLFGADNKEIGSGEINLLLSIHLTTGKTITYDYFTDKLRGN